MSFKIILIGAKCTWCEECADNCPTKALSFVEGLMSWDKTKCNECEQCMMNCTQNAMEVYYGK